MYHITLYGTSKGKMENRSFIFGKKRARMFVRDVEDRALGNLEIWKGKKLEIHGGKVIGGIGGKLKSMSIKEFQEEWVEDDEEEAYRMNR